MRVGRALRRGVMDRLIAEVPALAGRVFDRAAETTEYPYVTLGPSYWVDASAECIRARVMTLQVDVWGNAAKGPVEDLTDDVAMALESWAADDLAMHPLRLTLVRVMDDPTPGVVHGVVQVEAMVEG